VRTSAMSTTSALITLCSSIICEYSFFARHILLHLIATHQVPPQHELRKLCILRLFR
jgi:hypothetical protein